MTKILIAVFLGGGTGSLLRYCVRTDSALLLSLGHVCRQHNRKFSDRAVLCLVRTFQPIYGSTHVADHRIVRRLHHLFHILQ